MKIVGEYDCLSNPLPFNRENAMTQPTNRNVMVINEFTLKTRQIQY